MSTANIPVHESTYQALHQQLLFGGMLPGRPVTIRGLAQMLDVSPTPVREAVRRLIAENALVMHDNRRVSIPEMTSKRFQEIRLARLLLEPELAAQALAHITDTDIQALREIDRKTDDALDNGDIEGYMRGNYHFHFTLYKLASSDVLLGLVNSLWLQFGPYMRQVYGRVGTSSMDDQHRIAIAALEAKDGIAFKNAIIEDIQQGMTFIGRSSE